MALKMGWAVLPCHKMKEGPDGRPGPFCSCGNEQDHSKGKHPRTFRGVNDASSDVEVIQGWIDKYGDDGVNWAAATGAVSNLYVLDMDPRNGGEETLEEYEMKSGDGFGRVLRAKTGGGGIHVFLEYPEGMPKISSLGPGVDVKSDGGYVLLPGSNHVSGGMYEWIDETAPVGKVSTELSSRIMYLSSKAGGGVSVDFSKFSTEELFSKPFPEGGYDGLQGRDATLFKLACRWSRYGLNEHEILALSSHFGKVICTPPLSDSDILKCVKSALKQDRSDGVLFDGEVYPDWRGRESGKGETRVKGAALEALGESEASDDDGGWSIIDLGPYFRGEVEPVRPELMFRADGAPLLYRGKTHSFHGEAGSGKSMLAQWAALQVVRGGGKVLYLDYESSADSVVARWRSMGLQESEAAGMAYMTPKVDYGISEATQERFWALTEMEWDLVVIDGVMEAFTMSPRSRGGSRGGLGGNDELIAWIRRLPILLAEKTGAAVVMIDHVSKGSGSETGTRHAIGGIAKLNAITGAAYLVEIGSPLGRGMLGRVKVWVTKDREGWVNGVALMRGDGGMGLVAEMEVDGTLGDLQIEMKAPTEEMPSREEAVGRLEDAVLSLLRGLPTVEELTTTAIKTALRAEGVPVKDAEMAPVMGMLVDSGMVKMRSGARNAKLYSLVTEGE